MRQLTLLIITSLFIASLFIVGTPWAADSVPAFQYNNQHTGLTNDAGPDAPELLWRFRTNASLYSSPAVADDGTIYLTSTDGRLYALDAKGNVLWTFQADESIFGSPAIAPDGSVLFGDLAGTYYAVNADGSEKWIFDLAMGKERRITSAPVVDSNGQSYIGSWNEQFYAVGANGATQWRADLSGFVSACPAIDDAGHLYAAVNDSGRLNVVKFAPDSNDKLWTYEDDIDRDENRVISSPTVDTERNRVFVGVCSETGSLYAVNLDTGRRVWKKRLDMGIIGSPAIGTDGTVYVGCLDGKVYAYDADGEVKWTFDADGYFVLGSPSVDGNGVVYVGDSDGILYALSPDGQELWRYASNNSIESAPVVAPDGTLYFTSTDSTLYALKNPTAVWGWKTHE